MFLFDKSSKFITTMFVISVLFLFTLPARADEDAIAYVKVLNGAGVVVSGDMEKVLKIGDPLYRYDVIKTKDESSLGISFRDNTLISLGKNSSLKINNFAFDPENKKLAFAVQLFEGTLLYISGLISKLTKNPDRDLKITTPAGTITVRGTKLFVNAE